MPAGALNTDPVQSPNTRKSIMTELPPKRFWLATFTTFAAAAALPVWMAADVPFALFSPLSASRETSLEISALLVVLIVVEAGCDEWPNKLEKKCALGKTKS